jgi:hypothetical protein
MLHELSEAGVNVPAPTGSQRWSGHSPRAVPHRFEKAFGFGERNGVLMISRPSVEKTSPMP